MGTDPKKEEENERKGIYEWMNAIPESGGIKESIKEEQVKKEEKKKMGGVWGL